MIIVQSAKLTEILCHVCLISHRVQVNFVDSEGHRSKVPGRIGQSLHEVALLHGIDMDGHDSANNHYSFRRTEAWTEDVFGEGPSNAHDHVIVDPAWVDKVPAPMPEEATVLQEHVYHQDLTPHSRLGSQIYLSKVRLSQLCLAACSCASFDF